MNQDCPLCLEPLAVDDINFFPCECRYQICRFCWHRIRTDEDGRCPHCRLPYSENPAEYTPLTSEQLSNLKEKGRKKNHEKKQKLMENRKNLADVRVVQKNLVFVIGLSPRLADPEMLKKQEYFGKFGKIFKVVINHHTVYSGQQGPSVSAYVTYVKTDDASKAIQAVNNAFIDGRYLKASYGTTKYCSYFLRGVQCSKQDCMYLHELGESDASFTKEDMQLGKHQEYEQTALVNECVATVTSKDLQQQSSPPMEQDIRYSKSGHSKPRPRSVHESALPSSANWGSKLDGILDSNVERSHSSTSHRGNESRGLHRTNSFPVKSSNHLCDSYSQVHRRNGEIEDKSSECSLGHSRLDDSPNSLSSSVESVRSLSSDDGSNSVKVNEGKDFGKKPSKKKSKSGLARTLSEPVHKSEQQLHDVCRDGVTVTSECNEETFDRNDEEKENWDLDEITCNDSNVMRESTDEHSSIDVFKSLGSNGSCEFGSLGISWQTSEDSQVDSTKPTIGGGPNYMPMAWDPMKRGESTLLAAILSGSDASPPNTYQPVDEKQRLVSASYVNYGPTTNNGVSDHLVREISHKPCDGSHEMLRSTLENGFKTLFPGIHQGLPTSQLPSNQFSNSQSHHSSSEWPDLNTEKPAIVNKSSVAPPPGFAPKEIQNESSSSSATPNSYSLWGNSGNSSSSLQGLFQQNSVPKQPPVGAIPANVLEASLLASQQQQQQQQQMKQHHHNIMGIIGGPTGNPAVRIGSNMTPQSMLQQQLQQIKYFQRQQQMFIQQQQLRQQQQQMLKVAGMTTPQNPTNIGTRPINGFTNQRPVNPYFNAANYYGGWPGQPQYNWGVAPPRPVMNNFTQNMNNSTVSGSTSSKLVNPVQWTGQASLKPTAAQQMPGLEQGIQNINIKR